MHLSAKIAIILMKIIDNQNYFKYTRSSRTKIYVPLRTFKTLCFCSHGGIYVFHIILAISTVYIPQPYQPTGFSVEKEATHRPVKTGFLCIIYIWVALRGSFVFLCLQPNARMLPNFTSSAGCFSRSRPYLHASKFNTAAPCSTK